MRFSFVGLLAAWCVTFLPHALCAQQASSGLIRDINSQSLAQRVVQATGIVGRSQLSCEVFGDIAVDGDPPRSYQVVIKSQGSRRLHTELTTPKGVRHVYVKDGHGMLVREDGKQLTLSPENLTTQRLVHLPAIAFSDEYADPNLVSEYQEVGNSQEALSFRKRMNQGDRSSEKASVRVDQTTFSVDSQTGRITRTSYYNVAENAQSDVLHSETIYDDYREIDGLWVPFKQDTYENGKPVTQMTLRNVDCKQSFPESEFDIPELRAGHAR